MNFVPGYPALAVLMPGILVLSILVALALANRLAVPGSKLSPVYFLSVLLLIDVFSLFFPSKIYPLSSFNLLFEIEVMAFTALAVFFNLMVSERKIRRDLRGYARNPKSFCLLCLFGWSLAITMFAVHVVLFAGGDPRDLIGGSSLVALVAIASASSFVVIWAVLSALPARDGAAPQDILPIGSVGQAVKDVLKTGATQAQTGISGIRKSEQRTPESAADDGFRHPMRRGSRSTGTRTRSSMRLKERSRRRSGLRAR